MVNLERPRRRSILGLPAPCFVPSVSGAAKTDLALAAHVRALVEWGSPSLLVSAYDLHRLPSPEREAVFTWLDDALGHGTVVFMDSGGYEARWLRDSSWTIDDFHAVLLEAPHSVAFTFDFDDAPATTALERTAEFLGSASSLIPIIHGTGSSVEAAVTALTASTVAAVAVTERDLGAGLDSVAAALRKIVDAADGRVPIHVLGAGHPLSILVYVAVGASSFDGLDWCQTVADPATGTMHHSKHLSLFSTDTSCESEDYYLQLLSHNLVFYKGWMERIRTAIAQERLSAIVRRYLPDLLK